MAKVEVELLGYKEVSLLLEQLAAFGVRNQPLFNEIGLFLAAQVKQRTARGVDANEASFRPYSARHAAKRASLGLPIDHVDLFFTGSMLSSMTHSAVENQVTVYFAPTSDKFGGRNPEKAMYLNEGTNKMAAREFFAISAKDETAILALASTRLQQLLDGSSPYPT